MKLIYIVKLLLLHKQDITGCGLQICPSKPLMKAHRAALKQSKINQDALKVMQRSIHTKLFYFNAAYLYGCGLSHLKQSKTLDLRAFQQLVETTELTGTGKDGMDRTDSELCEQPEGATNESGAKFPGRSSGKKIYRSAKRTQPINQGASPS